MCILPVSARQTGCPLQNSKFISSQIDVLTKYGYILVDVSSDISFVLFQMFKLFEVVMLTQRYLKTLADTYALKFVGTRSAFLFSDLPEISRKEIWEMTDN